MVAMAISALCWKEPVIQNGGQHRKSYITERIKKPCNLSLLFIHSMREWILNCLHHSQVMGELEQK